MNNLSKKQNVYIAMSGGVDSSVAATLLVKEGYDCTGVFMKNWSGENWGVQDDCPWKRDQKDAQAVCKMLNIPFMSFNFEKQYREKIVDYFFDELKSGRTPNPDTLCNKEIKFGLFLNKAIKKGVDLIATGHYARNVKKGNYYHLLKGKDPKKDQSYFLYQLNQKQLSKTLFPIGSYTKIRVREIAKELKLPNAKKPDSQGICFIGKIDIYEFIKKELGEKDGDIITPEGEKIGEHKGIWFYTVGQREGIGIGGGTPYFVVDKNIKENKLIVVKGKNSKLLFKKEIKLKNFHRIGKFDYRLPLKCRVAIRYQQKPQPAILNKESKQYVIIFDEAQRAVTPGQSAVVYIEEECLGGGIIE